jgi:hypothetical protein
VTPCLLRTRARVDAPAAAACGCVGSARGAGCAARASSLACAPDRQQQRRGCVRGLSAAARVLPWLLLHIAGSGSCCRLWALSLSRVVPHAGGRVRGCTPRARGLAAGPGNTQHSRGVTAPLLLLLPACLSALRSHRVCVGLGGGGGGGLCSRHASCVCTEWCAPCHLSGSQRPRVCCAAGSCACAHRPQATLNMVPGGVCVFVCGAGQPVLVRMCRLHPTSAPVCCVSRGESERVWRGMVDGRRVRALRRCRAF